MHQRFHGLASMAYTCRHFVTESHRSRNPADNLKSDAESQSDRNPASLGSATKFAKRQMNCDPVSRWLNINSRVRHWLAWPVRLKDGRLGISRRF